MSIDSEAVNPSKKNDPEYCDESNLSDDNMSETSRKNPTLTEEDLLWIKHAKKTKMISEQSRNWAVLCLTVFSLILCVVFYLMCPEYLFFILFLSAILCPCFHPMNAPLWLSIILLVISGWTFTTGVFSVKWSGANKNPFTQ